jgi:hypothetical protein
LEAASQERKEIIYHRLQPKVKFNYKINIGSNP